MFSQMIANNSNTYTAIYCRLSQDDGIYGDSASIQNQKTFLRNYVLEKGWKLYDIYCDDGYSGTNFNRPGFKQMISDIEAGRINIVVTKDLSRLGRDHIETGRYIEQYFPDHNVRYIAINDNVDTFDENSDDLAPFKNIINEYYARDCSKKVRYTLNNHMKTGKPTKTSILLYGYLYDKENRRVPDPDAAPVIKFIFQRFIETQSCSQVAKELREKKAFLPLYYNYLVNDYNSEKYNDATDEDKYGWTRQTIYKILKKREYKGDYIRGKFKTRFKSNVRRKATEEEMYIFEHKYEALVSDEDFDKVQELLRNNINKQAVAAFNPYRRILRCAICGNPLRLQNDKKTGRTRLACRNNEGAESPSIEINMLNDIVKDDITCMQKYILDNEDEFLKRVLEYMEKQPYQKKVNDKKFEIENLKKKLEDTKNSEKNVFEDYHKKLLSRETYLSLLSSYSEQIQELENEIRVKEIEIRNSTYQRQDLYAEAKEYLKILKEFNFDIEKDYSLIPELYDSIMIKCEPVITKYKQRSPIIDFNVKGINEFVRGYIDGKQHKQNMRNIC